MQDRELYELITIVVILFAVLIIVFIAQFVLIIMNRNYVKEKDEANEKRFKEISEQNNLLIKKATELINNIEKLKI